MTRYLYRVVDRPIPSKVSEGGDGSTKWKWAVTATPMDGTIPVWKEETVVVDKIHTMKLANEVAYAMQRAYSAGEQAGQATFNPGEAYCKWCNRIVVTNGGRLINHDRWHRVGSGDMSVINKPCEGSGEVGGDVPAESLEGVA